MKRILLILLFTIYYLNIFSNDIDNFKHNSKSFSGGDTGGGGGADGSW